VFQGEEKEWTAYMLPQGYSDRLSARISQQVDVDWGNSVHQLTDIMDNAVPAKVFSNQSILCVGPDMVPQPKGKRVCMSNYYRIYHRLMKIARWNGREDSRSK
jgi:hypothetical protein